MSSKVISVGTDAEYRSVISKYAGQGYLTVHDGGGHATMSKKKPFNWVLAIICLFIPIIGWIALIMMIMAAGRGNKVVEIKRQSNS